MEQPGRKDSSTSQGSNSSHNRNPSNASHHSTTSLNALEDDYDPDLDDNDNEAESWSELVDPTFRRHCNAKETKRQCVIYELIQTETGYVKTLFVMKKIYYDGLKREMNIPDEHMAVMFPKVEEILELNSSFLHDMKTEQHVDEKHLQVGRIGNIILKHFGGENGQRFRDMYGYFCSHHRQAVALFKYYLKDSTEFQLFNQKCLSNARARRLSVPECITYMSMRLTKYPLLIEAIIKATTQASGDLDDCKASLVAVKQVLHGVDRYVDAYEQEQQLARIREQIDSMSLVKIKDADGAEVQFKAPKTIPKNARLLYYNKMRYRSNHKVYDIKLVIVTNKIIFFQEHPNTKKLQLLNVDNRSPVLPLKCVIGSKANAADNEVVFIVTKTDLREVLFEKQKEKREFIAKLDEIVNELKCKPPGEDEGDDEEEEVEAEEETEEERQPMDEEKLREIKECVDQLRDTDDQIRSLVKIKNDLVEKLYESTAPDGVSVNKGEDTPEEHNTRARLEHMLLEVNSVLTGWSLDNSPTGSPNVRRKASGTPSPKTKRRETPKKSSTFGESDQLRRGSSNIQKGMRSATLGAMVGGGLSMADSTTDVDPPPIKLSKQKQLKKLMTSSRGSFGSNEDISSRRSSTSSLATFSAPSSATVQAYRHLSEQVSSLLVLTNKQDVEMASMREELTTFRYQRSNIDEEVESLREELREQREQSERQLHEEREKYAKLSSDYKKLQSRERSRMTAAQHHQRQRENVVEYQL